MKLLRFLCLLLLISALVLESDAWFRRRRRRTVSTGCSTPPTLAYTYRSGCYYPYTNGERCTYRCQTGYRQVSGSTIRTCSYGRWSGTNLVCSRSSNCPSPPTLTYTYRSGCYSPYTNGERCTYRCWSGYTQVSGSTVRTCSNGRWTGTNLVCLSGRVCPTAPVVWHTIRSGCLAPYTQGESCYYRCLPGYTQISGSTAKTCSNGFWTGSSLVCRRGVSGCSIGPPYVTYTYRYGCSYPYTQGESCYYRCISGYTQVSGSTVRTCSSGGWTGTNLVCRRAYGRK
ncbi:complement factor H-like [Branchiostoma floridae x Branchiostoma japonicum]